MELIEIEFKQTEVGLIPVDWEVKTFREIFRVNQGLQIAISERKKHPTINSKKYITIQFLNEGKNIEYIGHYSTTVCCNEDDILMTRTGNTGVVVTGVKGVFHNNFFKINYDKSKLIREYIVYFLTQQSTQKKILDKAGTSTIPDLNHNDFYSLKIPLPPTLKEQKAIATALSDVDALIHSLEALIAKKKAIKQGTMQELLTGKTRLAGFENDKGYQQTEVGLIPVDWEVKQLNDVLRNFKLGGNYKNNNIDSNFPLIKMGNLLRGKITIKKLEYIENQMPDETDRLKYGDILFNTRNTLDLVGKVAVWRNELPVAYFNSNIMRFDFKLELVGSSFFMNYLFNTQRVINELKSFATGTTSVAAIYTRDLLRLNLPMPSIKEQKAIAETLSNMDQEIQALQTKKEKHQAIKQGMMQELLTGKTRLI